MDNDIIRIAEAMGWKWKASTAEGTEMVGRWYKDRACENVWVPYEAAPIDPLDSHADCHALIEWLRAEKGLQVAVLYHEGEDIVQLIEPGSGKAATDVYEGLDYRLGVVELTLKLLEKEDGNERS